jgi:salicylate hydroxylase
MYHRADLQEVLLSHVSSFVQCHLNHRLVNYTESEEGIELEFKNGKTASCDILVGADGINSVVRKVLLAGKRKLDSSSEEASMNAAPVWTGTWAYRGLVDSEIVKREIPNHPALTGPTIVRSHFSRFSSKFH